MRGSGLFCAVVVLGLAAASARADDRPTENPEPGEPDTIIEETSVGEAITETAAPGWHYPKAYASRPLTMNKFMIRGTFFVDVKRAVPGNTSGTATGAPLVSIDLGAAFSIFDNLEVGVSNYRLGSAPSFTRARSCTRAICESRARLVLLVQEWRRIGQGETP